MINKYTLPVIVALAYSFANNLFIVDEDFNINHFIRDFIILTILNYVLIYLCGNFDNSNYFSTPVKQIPVDQIIVGQPPSSLLNKNYI